MYTYTYTWYICTSKQSDIFDAEPQCRVRSVTLSCVALRYFTLRYVTVRHGTLRYGTLWYCTLRYGTLRCVTARYVTGRHGTARCGTSRCGTLRFGTVREVAVRCVALWCSTARTYERAYVADRSSVLVSGWCPYERHVQQKCVLPLLKISSDPWSAVPSDVRVLLLTHPILL